MNTIDEYVRQVMEHVPPASPEYGRIELDVRAHLEETVAAEGTAAAAIERMGEPSTVAAGYLADVPQRYAPFLTRVAAFLVDVALGLAVLALGAAFAGLNALGLGTVLGISAEPAQIGFGAATLIALVVAVSVGSLVYFPVLEWKYGQTLGKKLFGIHVVREDGRRIGLAEAAVRRIPFFLEFFWIDAVVALFTSRHQRAFDLVARTLVVECSPAARPMTVPTPDLQT